MLSLEFIPGWAISLTLALIIGLLIGLEQDNPPHAGHRNFSGVSTLPLISMGGYITLRWWPNQPVFLLGLAVMGLLITAMFVRNSMLSGKTGITQEISILLCWLLGGLIATGEWIAPLVIAVVTTLVLGRRAASTNKGNAGINKNQPGTAADDMVTLGKFVLLAMVAYLVLPNQEFTQLNINPRQIWSMMLLVTGIACIGYFGMRAVQGRAHATGRMPVTTAAKERRYLLLTALFSGLISSTALTLALSRLSHTRPELSASIATAIIAASTVMFVRLLLEVAIVQPALLPITTVLFLPTLIAGAWLTWRNHHSNMSHMTHAAQGGASAVGGRMPETAAAHGDDGASANHIHIPFSNPLDLTTVLQFGALYGLLFALVQLAFNEAGAMGVYALSLAAGIVSVDAVALSMAQLHAGSAGSLPAAVVVLGITLAAVGNLLVKLGMVWGLANRSTATPAATGLGAIITLAAVSVGIILILAWRAA